MANELTLVQAPTAPAQQQVGMKMWVRIESSAPGGLQLEQSMTVTAADLEAMKNQRANVLEAARKLAGNLMDLAVEDYARRTA